MNGTHETPTEQIDPAGFHAWLSAGAAASPVAGRTVADWQRLNDERPPLTAAERYELAIQFAPGLSSAHNSPRVETESRRERLQGVFGHQADTKLYADKIEWADGADVLRLKRAPCPSSFVGGGTRGAISCFSGASRHRLLTFVNSIDRREVAPERIWFVTLTYPGVYPTDPRKWKRQLEALRKRIKRAWGHIPAIWKLEPQHRGAPHFHLLLLMPDGMCRGLRVLRRVRTEKRIKTYWTGGDLSSFREWLSRAWFEVVDSGDERHLRAGTNCEPLEAWRKVVSYASKYIGKDCVFTTDEGETQAVGRYWGVWHRESFPIAWRARYVPRDTWAKVRRTIRRMCKGQRVDHLRRRAQSATVFVSADTIARLISWTESVHDQMRQECGSTKAVMQAVGFIGDMTAWYAAFEDDRQRYHRERQAIGRTGRTTENN